MLQLRHESDVGSRLDQRQHIEGLGLGKDLRKVAVVVFTDVESWVDTLRISSEGTSKRTSVIQGMKIEASS